MQIVADVLQREVVVHPSEQGPATGAAVYAAAAAGAAFGDLTEGPSHDVTTVMRSLVPPLGRSRDGNGGAGDGDDDGGVGGKGRGGGGVAYYPRSEYAQLYNDGFTEYMAMANPTEREAELMMDAARMAGGTGGTGEGTAEGIEGDVQQSNTTATQSSSLAPAASAFSASSSSSVSASSSSDSDQHRVAVLKGPRSVVAGWKPAPRLPPNGHATEPSVLVNVEAVGICGSDLHYYRDGGIGSATIDARDDWVPGHEFAGRVAALSGGSMQDAAGRPLEEGDLVAVDPARPCMDCEFCRRGHTNLCPRVQFLGAPPVDGGMSERIVVPAESCWKVPSGNTAVEAMMLEPLGVAIHALDLDQPRHAGETVCILGAGPIGQLVGQLMCLVTDDRDVCDVPPRTIIIYDPVTSRCQLATDLLSSGRVADVRAVSTDWCSGGGDAWGGAGEGGADVGCDRAGGESGVGGGFEDGPAAIAALTNGRGCDLVIEATNSPDGLSHAAGCAAIGGRVVVIGIPDGTGYSSGHESGLWQADALRRKVKGWEEGKEGGGG
jgi:L-iditol 2-dehydrogenase